MPAGRPPELLGLAVEVPAELVALAALGAVLEARAHRAVRARLDALPRQVAPEAARRAGLVRGATASAEPVEPPAEDQALPSSMGAPAGGPNRGVGQQDRAGLSGKSVAGHVTRPDRRAEHDESYW